MQAVVMSRATTGTGRRKLENSDMVHAHCGYGASTAARRDSNADVVARPKEVYQMAMVKATAALLVFAVSWEYCSVVAATLARKAADWDRFTCWLARSC